MEEGEGGWEGGAEKAGRGGGVWSAVREGLVPFSKGQCSCRPSRAVLAGMVPWRSRRARGPCPYQRNTVAAWHRRPAPRRQPLTQPRPPIAPLCTAAAAAIIPLPQAQAGAAERSAPDPPSEDQRWEAAVDLLEQAGDPDAAARWAWRRRQYLKNESGP